MCTAVLATRVRPKAPPFYGGREISRRQCGSTMHCRMHCCGHCALVPCRLWMKVGPMRISCSICAC
eukprot:5032668-Prymnesium_polylepis.1